MNAFQFVTPASLDEASGVLRENNSHAQIMAGGTDLMGEIKERVVNPSIVVSLVNIQDMKGIAIGADGLRIGALTTVAEIESNPEIIKNYTALAQAAAVVATPQIRNVGTLGGNLCQRPRCWYYRSPLFDCRKKGGTECFAYSGSNKFHAILEGEGCHIVHPSDLAVALISLKAEATIAGQIGERTMPLEDFFVGPGINVLSENVLGDGDILASIFIPASSPNSRSIYLKAKERQAMDFALSSIALAVELDDGIIRDARVTLGGVAPTPYRVPQAEATLNGKRISEVVPDDIGAIAVQDAKPLKDNGYKVRLTSSLVRRAINELLS